MVHADPPQSNNRNEASSTDNSRNTAQCASVCVCVFPAIVMSEPTKLWPSIDLLPCKLIVLHHVIPQKR